MPPLLQGEEAQDPSNPSTLWKKPSPPCPFLATGNTGKSLEEQCPSRREKVILSRGDMLLQGEVLPPLPAPHPLIRLLQMDWLDASRMNPRIPPLTGAPFRAPPMPRPPMRSTQPPSGLAKPPAPPKGLISDSAAWTCRTKCQNSLNFPMSSPTIPFLKLDGDCHSPTESLT